jgi:hypothetical protein
MRLIRNEVIEECAKIADRGAAEMRALKTDDLIGRSEEASVAAGIAETVAEEIAAAIRALVGGARDGA